MKAGITALAALLGIFLGHAAGAQTTVQALGNLKVKDDPATANYTEGHLFIDGSIFGGANRAGGATGANSIAMGYATASGQNSFALGHGALAFGQSSASVGVWSMAYENHSLSFGFYPKAFSYGSLAFGHLNEARGIHAMAFGRAAYATGTYAIAAGYNVRVGRRLWEGDANTPAFAEKMNNYSVAIGYDSNVMGTCSYLMGRGSNIGVYSTDDDEVVLADYSFSFGHYNTVKKYGSMAFGYGVTTDSIYQTTLGVWSDSESLGTFNNNWRPGDPLLVIGNGSGSASRSNALVMKKNGDTNFKGNVEAESVKIRALKGGISMGRYGAQ